MIPEQENKWEEDLRELQRHTPKKCLFSKRINFLFSKLRDQFENHENKLKDLDQEISRLKAEIEESKNRECGAIVLSGELYRNLLPVYESEQLRKEEIFDDEWFEELGELLDRHNKTLSGVFDLSEYYTFKKQLKSLEQENERFKKDAAIAAGRENLAYDLMGDLKEHDKMIREAIPWVVRYYESKAPLKNEWNFIRNWLEKANKITRGEG